MRDILLDTHDIYMGVHRTPADGNCLFHSLAFPSGKHDIVRKWVVDHIEHHWQHYSQFLTEDERPFYCKKMRRVGVWGDELVIKAFADATGVGVNVYDSSTHHLIESYKPKHLKPLIETRNLLFDGSHYNVLKQMSPYRERNILKSS